MVVVNVLAWWLDVPAGALGDHSPGVPCCLHSCLRPQPGGFDVSHQPQSGPTDPVVRLLAETEFFGGLPADDLRQIAALARRQRARAGQVLVQAGTPARVCWVVAQGTLEVNDGGDARLVGRGAVVDASALLREGPARATVSARDEVELIMVPGEAGRRLVSGDTLAGRLLALARDTRGAAPGASGAPSPEQPGPAASHEGSELGRTLQRSMLPRNAPRVPGYDIAAGTTVEDRGRGNSVWDAFELADGRWALSLFDVRGGEVPALLLGMARAALRTAAPAANGLADLLARANGGLAGVLGPGRQFVECALVVPGPDGVEWAAAGRVPAGVLGRAGTLEALASHGPPLGMLDGFRYGSERAAMGVGDSLLALSSGSTGLFRGAADLVVQVQEKTAGEVVGTVHKGLRAALDDPTLEVSVLFLRRH